MITLESKISELNVMVRVVNALKNGATWGEPKNINTVGEVIEYSANELLRIPNFGRVSLKGLEDELRVHGFALRGTSPIEERIRAIGEQLILLQESLGCMQAQLRELKRIVWP